MNSDEALARLAKAWPLIVQECRQVLGGELHYQAVVYHCLRLAGVPAKQLGMNVKQYITDPITADFKTRVARSHPDFQQGFEPIPDVVLFAPEVAGDWRRRRHEFTAQHMLAIIEVKASERAGSRLRLGEISSDIRKLAAHRDELAHRGFVVTPVMMVIDVAPETAERMTEAARERAKQHAIENAVSWMYCSPTMAEPPVSDPETLLMER